MPWFKPFGFAYVPDSIAGWIVSILAVVFCVHIFLHVDAGSHSATDTLYGVFPYWVPTLLLWAWIAERMARPRDGSVGLRR